MTGPTKRKEKHPSFLIMEQKMIRFNIGPHAEAFSIHMGLVIHYSGYFRAALTGKFTEAEEKKFALPHIDVHVFRCFMDWCYYRRLPLDEHQEEDRGKDFELDCGTDAPTPLAAYDKVIDLYLFGDYYDIPDLRHAAMDYVFVAAMEDIYPSQDHIIKIFRNLSASSPLRRFCIDVYSMAYETIMKMEGRNLFEDGSDLPQAFLCGILLKLGHAMEGVKALKAPARKSLFEAKLKNEQAKKSYSKEVIDYLYHDAITLHSCAFHEHECEEEATLCEESCWTLTSDF